MVLANINILNQTYQISLHPRMLRKLSKPFGQLSQADFKQCLQGIPHIKLIFDEVDRFDWTRLKTEDIVEILELDTNLEPKNEISMPIYYELINETNLDIIYFCLETRSSMIELPDGTFIFDDAPLAFLCDYFKTAHRIYLQEGLINLVKHISFPISSFYYIEDNLRTDLISFYVTKATSYIHSPSFQIKFLQRRLIDICYIYKNIISNWFKISHMVNHVLCLKDIEISSELVKTPTPNFTNPLILPCPSNTIESNTSTELNTCTESNLYPNSTISTNFIQS